MEGMTLEELITWGESLHRQGADYDTNEMYCEASMTLVDECFGCAALAILKPLLDPGKTINEIRQEHGLPPVEIGNE